VLSSNSMRLRTPSFWVEFARTYVLVEPAELTKIVFETQRLDTTCELTSLIVDGCNIPMFVCEYGYSILIESFYAVGKKPPHMTFKSPDTERLWNEILEKVILPVAKSEVKKEPEKKHRAVRKRPVQLSSQPAQNRGSDGRYKQLEEFFSDL